MAISNLNDRVTTLGIQDPADRRQLVAADVSEPMAKPQEVLDAIKLEFPDMAPEIHAFFKKIVTLVKHNQKRGDPLHTDVPMAIIHSAGRTGHGHHSVR